MILFDFILHAGTA